MTRPWSHRRGAPAVAVALVALVLAGAGGMPGTGPPTEGLGRAPVALSPVGVGSESTPASGRPLDRAAVTSTLAPLLRGGALGAGPTPAHVIDVATGAVLYAAAGGPAVPASTMKAVTAASVLQSLGATHRLRTRAVLLRGSGTLPRVVVVGSGDPSLSSTGEAIGGPGERLRPASLAELARASSRSLTQRGISSVRVGYDASLFRGRSLHPSWAASFPAVGIVAPVSALMVDEGRFSPTSRSRVTDPALAASREFADRLEDAGIRVRGEPRAVVAPLHSPALAFVASPPVGDLVERTLAVSDNTYAEALGRLAALAGGERASFAGVSRRAATVLRELGVRVPGARFVDASGLSRGNRLRPRTLTDLLQATSSGFGPLHSGLAVASGNGTLANRFTAAGQRAGRGVVRAKTGSLTGVVGLSGYARRPDGRLLAFAFLDDTATGGAAARSAVDRAAAALISCDCATTDAADPAPGPQGAAGSSPGADPSGAPGPRARSPER